MPSPSAPEVARITVADEPGAWAAAGFRVDDDRTCRVGGVRLVLAGAAAGRGVVGWALRGTARGAPGDLDGFPTEATDDGLARPADHPCGATSIDHLVLLTDDLARTCAAAAGMGLDLRRTRDHATPDGRPVTQAFFRVGEVVLEVVAPADPPDEPRAGVHPFGLALVVPDLHRAKDLLGDALSEVRPAVQPGREIATVRHRALGLTTTLALMTPHPGRSSVRRGRG